MDAYASDEEVGKMSEGEKGSVLGKAKREVDRQMKEDMGSVIALQLWKWATGLRLVDREREREDWH